jgi:hypothetical protein
MVTENRTQDFHSIVLRQRKNNIVSPLPKQAPKSAFSVAAQQISKEICATHEKLEKLAKRMSFKNNNNTKTTTTKSLTAIITTNSGFINIAFRRSRIRHSGVNIHSEKRHSKSQ